MRSEQDQASGQDQPFQQSKLRPTRIHNCFSSCLASFVS
jgi:hypothetical protein